MINKNGMVVMDLVLLMIVLRCFFVIRTDFSLSWYILLGVGDLENSPTARSGSDDPRVPIILISIFGFMELFKKILGTVSPLIKDEKWNEYLFWINEYYNFYYNHYLPMQINIWCRKKLFQYMAPELDLIVFFGIIREVTGIKSSFLINMHIETMYNNC